MNDNGEDVKRDRLDILLDMLESTTCVIKKTRLQCKVNLNFTQLQKYLSTLLELGLLEKVIGSYEGYITTEKGRLVLELFNHSAQEKVGEPTILYRY